MHSMERRDRFLLPRLSSERWQELQSFHLKDGDVFIAGFPKSGTTWMQQIVKLLRSGGDVRLDRAIPWLEVMDSDFGKRLGFTPDMATSSDIISPRAFKTHFPYELVPGGLPHTTPAKYIYVMRNPKDVCVSYWHHRNFIGTYAWDEHFSEFVSIGAKWGGWFYHILGWWKHRDSPNILYIKYKDLKTDPLTAISTIAQFIGIQNMTDELLQNTLQKSSFSSMKADLSCNNSWLFRSGLLFEKAGSGEFIRNGEVGSWRDQFSEEQSKVFDDLFANKMSGSGVML